METCTSVNTTAARGPGQYDNVIMMMMVSIVVPIVTAAISKFLQSAADKTPDFSSIVQKWKNGKNNKVTITQTSTYGEKKGWTFHPDEDHNGRLITSVLNYLSNRDLHAQTSSLCLSNVNFTGSLENIEMTRQKTYKPVGEIICGEFKITHTRIITTLDKGGYELKLCMTIFSKLPTKSIKDFIDKCYQEYVDSRRAKIIDTRYAYKQIPSKGGNRFKKYPINNVASFDNMYFPEKEKVIEMFAKLADGDLKKLSFMLHGIPGSGKTSFIKSVANHLNYDIIEVKLAYMAHDGNLMDIFHTESIISFQHNDDAKGEIVDYIPTNKRIYVFEDIDAESDVVHQRKPESEPITPVPSAILPKVEDDLITAHYKEVMKSLSKEKLTLAGVLNAIDGILEINGSIIIMTTNHPEKLDAALVRPGRITMKIEMGKMAARDANEMIKKKFGSTIDCPDNVFTPAELESYCQIASSIDELTSMICSNEYKKI